MALDDLYREVIMEHYRSPRNHTELDDPSFSLTLTNPLCGDEITLYLRIADGRVVDVTFLGRGCSISQASASLMTEAIKGKTITEAVEIMHHFRGMMRGEHHEDDEILGDLVALSGVVKFPIRVKCAILPWEALRQTLTPDQPPEQLS
ncbi:MAG: Fe-S cluster assembly sulfur transfer protein SufU [Limnochordia bacterium]|jgi:nitrogen fixation NifU-like protein